MPGGMSDEARSSFCICSETGERYGLVVYPEILADVRARGAADAAHRRAGRRMLDGAGAFVLRGADGARAGAAGPEPSLCRSGARNTPLLVQLFFLYFGLPKIGIKWSGEVCAIVGLTLQGGAYMAESFRSGLEAVERTQKEAGACLGLSGAQNFRHAQTSPGAGHGGALAVREHRVPDQGDERAQRGGAGRPDVRGQGPDRACTIRPTRRF